MELNEQLAIYPIQYDKDSEEIIVLSDIDNSTLIKFLNKLFDLELSDLSIKYKLILKNLPFELKCEAIKHALTRSDLNDQIMLLNIFNLVKSYSNFSDDYFSNKYIIFNSIEEFIDIKLNCKIELKNFKTNLVKYFIAALKSYNITINSTELVELPKVYMYLLSMLSFVDMSKLISDHPINTGECGVVSEGIGIIDNMILRNNLANVIMKQLNK